MRVDHTIGTAVVLAIAAGFQGCASQGSRGAARGEGIASRLGDRAAQSQSAAAFAGRGSTSPAGPATLPGLARLNRDTPAWSEVEFRPAPPPVGQYGPVGDYGIAPPPFWPPDPYYAGFPPGYPSVGPGGFAVGGGVPYGLRPPHDAGRDTTGLAGAIQGGSAYRNPGEGDGAAHRPGLATGTGPFEKSLEAERRAEAPPPSSHGSDHHGR